MNDKTTTQLAIDTAFACALLIHRGTFKFDDDTACMDWVRAQLAHATGLRIEAVGLSWGSVWPGQVTS